MLTNQLSNFHRHFNIFASICQRETIAFHSHLKWEKIKEHPWTRNTHFPWMYVWICNRHVLIYISTNLLAWEYYKNNILKSRQCHGRCLERYFFTLHSCHLPCDSLMIFFVKTLMGICLTLRHTCLPDLNYSCKQSGGTHMQWIHGFAFQYVKLWSFVMCPGIIHA